MSVNHVKPAAVHLHGWREREGACRIHHASAHGKPLNTGKEKCHTVKPLTRNRKKTECARLRNVKERSGLFTFGFSFDRLITHQ